MKKFLQSQDSYTLHFATPKRFLTQKIISAKPKVIISLDLIDVKNLAKYNSQIKYLMYYIDIFSKRVTIITLKDKTKNSILLGLKKFFSQEDNHKYSRIYSDLESGLYSNLVKQYLSKIKKKLYSNSSKERKNSIAERGIRSFKNKLYKYLTHHKTFKFLDVIQDIVNSINNSWHRSLKSKELTPNILHQITDKDYLKSQFHKMYDTNIYSRVNKTSSHLHKINDIVRIPKTEYTQNQFYKKFNVLNTEELFRITDIKKNRYPYLYKLSDLSNEKIIGSFYSVELIPSALKKNILFK